MSVGRSGPLIAAGFAIWTLGILTDGNRPIDRRVMRGFSVPLALSALAFFLNHGDDNQQYRRPPPRRRRGRRPFAADCPAPTACRVGHVAWVPPRLRY